LEKINIELSKNFEKSIKIKESIALGVIIGGGLFFYFLILIINNINIYIIF
jgi:hypothetical protein